MQGKRRRKNWTLNSGEKCNVSLWCGEFCIDEALEWSTLLSITGAFAWTDGVFFGRRRRDNRVILFE